MVTYTLPITACASASRPTLRVTAPPPASSPAVPPGAAATRAGSERHPSPAPGTVADRIRAGEPREPFSAPFLLRKVQDVLPALGALAGQLRDLHGGAMYIGRRARVQAGDLERALDIFEHEYAKFTQPISAVSTTLYYLRIEVDATTAGGAGDDAARLRAEFETLGALVEEIQAMRNDCRLIIARLGNRMLAYRHKEKKDEILLRENHRMMEELELNREMAERKVLGGIGANKAQKETVEK